MSRFRISIERLADPAAAAAVWRALAPRADASFFTSWPWIGSWLAATSVDALLVSAHDGATLVAAGLFGRTPDGRVLLHETGVAAWDRLTVEYNDLLIARDLADDPRPACLAALAAAGEARAIGLSGVDASWLGAAARAGLPARGVRRRPTFAMALVPADTPDVLIERCGASTRAALRQTLRRLGPVTGSAAASRDEAHAWLDALIALHQASWRARGEPGAFGDARIGAFHHRLIDAGWDTGAVELFMVAGPTGPLAYLLNFRHGDVVHAYQAGVVGGLPGRLKPGLVAHIVCASHHTARGARSYDLMAGDARYKRSLGAPAHELVWLTLYPTRTAAAVADLRRVGRGLASRLRVNCV